MGLKLNTYGENIEDKSYAVQNNIAKSRAKARQALLEAERQRQLAEAERQRRIEEYKIFNDNISNISKEMVAYYNELQEIENLVRANMSGSEADGILKNIQGIRSQCETAITQLNNAGAKTTGRLHAEGESNYYYIPTQIPSQKANKTNNSQTFSCNTETLRDQVLDRLFELGTNLLETSNELNAIAVPTGCETVKTIPGGIVDSATQVCTAYNQIVDFIIQVESVEQQNDDLIKRTFADFADFAKLTDGKDGQLVSEDLLNERDYDFEAKYYWGEAFNSVTNLEEGKIVKDLNNGKQIIWRNEGANKLSNTGSYFILTGYSDGKVTIENPNDNTTQEVDLSKLASYGGAFYSYGLKDYSEETEIELPDLKYITLDDLRPKTKQTTTSGQFGTDIAYTTEEVPFGGSTTQMLVPSTSGNGTMKTLRLVLAGGEQVKDENGNIINKSDVDGMRNAVWKATQEGDLTFDGYTLVLPYYANPDSVIAMIQEIAQTHNIDVENIVMPAFSMGGSHSLPLASAINNSDNNIHVSEIDYISGGGANPDILQELANDPSITINAYYGTGDLDSTKQRMEAIFANYDNITITEIPGGHDTSDNGIVAEYFKNYAGGKQNLTLGEENTTTQKPTTGSPNITDQGTYHFYQQDYDYTWDRGAKVPYGDNGMNCGPTSLCMVISNRLGIEFPPSALRYLSDNYEDGRIGSETNGNALFYDEDLLSLVGIKCQDPNWGYNDNVSEALSNENQMVIGQALGEGAGDTSIFTKTGHFITMTGYRDNGNINVDDPNYYNYTSTNSKLVDGFENGFSEDVVKSNVNVYYVFDYEEPKLSLEEIQEIVDKAKDIYGK